MSTPVGASLEVDFNTATALNSGWITREDAALRQHLRGMRVSVTNDQEQDDDDRDGPRTVVTAPAGGSKTRVVPVFFRFPENEKRTVTYPLVTIDFLQPVRDTEREHRGVATYGTTANAYTPPGMPEGGGRGELPIPMTLMYQVTQYARFARHDRQILTQLMTQRLEPRFGMLEMVAADHEVDDHSFRRLDLLSGPTNGDGRDEQGKRLFRKSYTVGIQSELFHSELVPLAAVQRVDLTVLEL